MVNWDRLFAYSTVKVVLIQDKNLGILHYLFQAAIFLYVVIFVTLFNQGYLGTERIVGTMKLSVVPPNRSEVDIIVPYCTDELLPADGTPSCRVGTPESITVGPNDLSSSFFFATHETEQWLYRICDECNFKDYLRAFLATKYGLNSTSLEEYISSIVEARQEELYPAGTLGALPPFSRAPFSGSEACSGCTESWITAEELTELLCTQYEEVMGELRLEFPELGTLSLCDTEGAGPGNTFTVGLRRSSEIFYKELEKYLVDIEHTAVARRYDALVGGDTLVDECTGEPLENEREARTTKFRGSSTRMIGVVLKGEASILEKPNDDVIASNPDLYQRLPCDEPDLLSIGEILGFIHNVNLTSLDDNNTEFNDNTWRESGMILSIGVTYTNTYNFFAPSQMRYVYDVSRVPNSFFSTTELLGTDKNTAFQHRVLRIRNGIRIDFIQGGDLGRFDFQVLLTQLVTSLGLLAVATTVVDLLALKVLPRKRQYNEAKYLVHQQDRLDMKVENNLQQVQRDLDQVEMSNLDGAKELAV